MPLPLRNLPVLQNWDCHSCTDCCRIEAPITDEDKRRIEALDLGQDPEIGAAPWFVRRSWWSTQWKLRHRPDGSCVFLTRQNRCRLHERFGPETKPLGCRLFPFLLIPGGNHVRTGLRFSCPSAAANQGRPVTEQAGELARLANQLEQQTKTTAENVAAPFLQLRQSVSWPDLHRFVEILVDIVKTRRDRLEVRLRKCLAMAHICRQARFENISGNRLREFLEIVREGLDAEMPSTPPAPPSWLGRMLFRTLLAVFARKDVGLHRGPATRTPLGRLRAGWRFIRGRGKVPAVNRFLPGVTFAEVETLGGLPASIDETLERYYLVKLHSLQFCGRANFDLPFWTGLEALVLTYPMILWLTRAFKDMPPERAVENALFLVDDHFAGNPVLALRHNRYFLRTLVERGDLERLIAWYSR